MALHPILTEKLNAALAQTRPDFLARRPSVRPELIQVCADLTSPETRARELRALVAAAREHPDARLRLLVLDRDALGRGDASGVEVLPAYEWLLVAVDKD